MTTKSRCLITFSCLMFISNLLLGQSNINPKTEISITQECWPDPNPLITYKVTASRITIKMTRKIFKQKIKVTETIYSMRFIKTQKDSLLIILKKIDLSKYKNSYSAPVLDGVAWDFNIKSIYGSKTVSMWNYYLPDFGLLLDFLNRQLPKEKRYISFDLLGIRKRTLNN